MDTLKSVTGATNTFSVALGSIGKNAFIFNEISDSIGQLNNVLGSLDVGANFEQAGADFKAITGIAGTQFEELQGFSRKIGEEMGVGATEGMNAMKNIVGNIDISKLGKDATEQANAIKNLTLQSTTLAQAGMMPLDDAASVLTGTLNQYNLGANASSKVLDIMAAGAKYGATEIQHLSETYKIAGTTANLAGLSLQDLTAATEVLGSKGIKGAEAGTALRNVFLKLQTEGIEGVDLKTNGLAKSLDAMKGKLYDTTFMSKTFGAENINAAQILIGNTSLLKDLTLKVNENGVAQEMQTIRMATHTGAMARMKAILDDIRISVFNVAGAWLPYLNLLGGSLETMAHLGMALPILKPMLGDIATGFRFIGKNTMLALTQMLTFSAGALTAVGSFVLAMGNAIAAQIGLNVAMTANPIGLIIVGLAAVAASIYLIIKNWDYLKSWILDLGAFMWKFNPFNWIFQLIDYVFPQFKGVLNTWGNDIKAFFMGIFDWIWNKIIQPIVQIFQDLFDIGTVKMPTIDPTASAGIDPYAPLGGDKIKGKKEPLGTDKGFKDAKQGQGGNIKTINIYINDGLVKNMTVVTTKDDRPMNVRQELEKVILTLMNNVNTY